MTTNIHILVSRWILEWEMFQEKVVEKIKTHILCSITLFFLQNPCLLWDNVEKYSKARQARDDDMDHAHCMLGTSGYKYTTLRLCNTYCFSTTTTVARTRLDATLYVHCLSCFLLVFRFHQNPKSQSSSIIPFQTSTHSYELGILNVTLLFLKICVRRWYCC